MSERPEDRIDALVRDAERRTWENAPSDEVTAARDRDAVMARIEGRAAHRRRPVRPWWRVAAPFAVAAGLAGLFLLRDQVAPETPTAPDPVVAETPVRETAPSARRSEETARETAAARTAAKSTGTEPTRLAPTVPVATDEAVSDPGSLVALPVAREVDGILEALGTIDDPQPLADAARDSLVDRLRALREHVQDRERADRVDAWIRPRQ